MPHHANAKLTPKSRLTLVRRLLEGQPVASVAMAFHVSPATARKWLRRYREDGGSSGLFDRSSRPKATPTRTCQEIVDRVIRLRAYGYTYSAIADELGMAISTVGLICKRDGPLGQAARDGR